MDSLKQAILDIIYRCYEKHYIGPMKVKALPGGGWDLQLGFQNEEKPLHIAAQLEDKDFLKYVESEIRKRHLSHEHFYTGYQKYPEGEPIPIDRTEHAIEDTVYKLHSKDHYDIGDGSYSVTINK